MPFDDVEERQIFQRLKDDFPHYAARCLKIRTKAGKVDALKLNAAQLYIHKRIEEQLAATGRVRAVILKGRQQGCSTYVEGRFYWKVSHRLGVRAFILTHEQDATDNLFEMASRYHEHCPDLVKPSTGAANAKELHFDKLDSGYKVGTAGSKAVGRSQTLQYFHGSEIGYWPFAENHASGIMQAVPNEEGTEIILESTANGPAPISLAPRTSGNMTPCAGGSMTGNSPGVAARSRSSAAATTDWSGSGANIRPTPTKRSRRRPSTRSSRPPGCVLRSGGRSRRRAGSSGASTSPDTARTARRSRNVAEMPCWSPSRSGTGWRPCRRRGGSTWPTSTPRTSRTRSSSM
jgi:hypothetical protein